MEVDATEFGKTMWQLPLPLPCEDTDAVVERLGLGRGARQGRVSTFHGKEKGGRVCKEKQL